MKTINKYFGWNLFIFTYESLGGGRFGIGDRIFGAALSVAFCKTLIVIGILKILKFHSIFGFEIIQRGISGFEVNPVSSLIILTVFGFYEWVKFRHFKNSIEILNEFKLEPRSTRSLVKVYASCFYVLSLIFGLGVFII